jgi:hypothetical protein
MAPLTRVASRTWMVARASVSERPERNMLVPNKLSQASDDIMIDVVIGERAMIAGKSTFNAMSESILTRLTWPDLCHPDICLTEEAG